MLIDDIQRGTAGRIEDLPNVVRKALALATEWQIEPLKQWCEHELRGYPDEVELPRYRRMRTQIAGNFVNAAYHGQNVPISTEGFPDDLAELLETYKAQSPLATYIDLLQTGKNMFGETWPTGMVQTLNQVMSQALYQVHWVLPRTFFVNLVEGARDTLFQFCIDIRQQYPERVRGKKSLPATRSSGEVQMDDPSLQTDKRIVDLVQEADRLLAYPEEEEDQWRYLNIHKGHWYRDAVSFIGETFGQDTLSSFKQSLPSTNIHDSLYTQAQGGRRQLVVGKMFLESLKGRQVKRSMAQVSLLPQDEPNTKQPTSHSNLWSAILPLLFVFLVVVVALIITAMLVSPFVFSLVLIATILCVIIIVVFALRSVENLSEKGFLQALEMVIKSLPLLGNGRQNTDPDKGSG